VKKLAIIIINWNSLELTSDTLKALQHCSFRDFDVILVDNGSTDGSRETLQQNFQKIIPLFSPENIGFTGGNNLGMHYALEKGYPYIMLLNNDVDVTPDFLEPLIARMDADPQMGAIQPLIMFHHNRNLVWNAGGKYMNWIGVSKTLTSLPETNALSQIDWITGCAFMIKAEVLKKVGLLEEKYFIYHEDVDLSLRIRKAGYSLYLEPHSVIYHIAGMSQKTKTKGKEGFVSPKVHYLNARNRIWTIRKYTKLVEWPTVFIYQFLYMLTISMYFILRGRHEKRKSWWLGIRHGLIFLISVLVFSEAIKAQTVDLDNPQLEEIVRRAQLMGKLESDLSFNVRPVQPRKIGDWDSLLPMAGKKPLLGRGLKFLGKSGYIDFTPLQLTTQYAANSPFKGNDGPMIPATGLQTMLSGGFFMKLGPLTIQAKPQVVYAQNTPFRAFPQEHSLADWQSYLAAMSKVDLPERFGSNRYQKSFLGNSSIRLNFGPLSFGISNENLWWGPAASNALIMGSHAPGFLHASINTRHPWKTPIGSFEFQLISGFLDSSGYPLPSKIEGNLTTRPKKPEKRYLNAAVFSYQPQFLKGVSFGLIRAVQEYTSWLKENGQWFLLVNNISRQQDADFNVEINRDQQASLFSRWVIEKANAEFYVEWGRNDAFYALRDLFLQPNHSRAYTLGFRKIFPKKNKYHFEFYTESTKQKQSTTRIIRDSNPDWYMHSHVTHGMTHRGEVLGAYVGPGSDFKMLRVSMFNDKKSLSVQFERTSQFTDMYERIFGTNDPNVRRWVDYMLRFQGQYRFKNMIFNAQLALKYSYNYYWYQETATEFRGMNYTGDLPAAMLQTGVMWRL
jgi:GT2 family glycosyltransferase